MTLPKDTPLTLADLERLARLEQAATPGRWFVDIRELYILHAEPNGNEQMVADDGGDAEGVRMRGFGARLPMAENAKLICALRNHAQALLALAIIADQLRRYVNRGTQAVYWHDLADILEGKEVMPR